MLFAHRQCYIFDDAGAVATSTVIGRSDAMGEHHDNGQYTTGGRGNGKEGAMASAPVSGTATIWNRRFSHLSYSSLKKVAGMWTACRPMR